MGLARWLFGAARTADDIETLASGDPARIARRGVNKLVGRRVVSRLYLRGRRRRRGARFGW